MAIGETMQAVQITEFGGPEVLKTAEVSVPQPDAGEVLVQLDVAGINFPISIGAKANAAARRRSSTAPREPGPWRPSATGSRAWPRATG